MIARLPRIGILRLDSCMCRAHHASAPTMWRSWSSCLPPLRRQADRRAVIAQEPGIRNRSQRACRIRSGSDQQLETVRGRAGWPDSGHPKRRRAGNGLSRSEGRDYLGRRRTRSARDGGRSGLRDERPVLCQLYRPCREHRHRALSAFEQSGSGRFQFAVRSAVAVRAQVHSSALRQSQ